MKRFILTILILAVLALIVGIATGFIDLNASGQLRAPKVEVQAQPGEIPKMDIETDQVVVGTTNSTIRVPTVAVKDDEQPAPKQ